MGKNGCPHAPCPSTGTRYHTEVMANLSMFIFIETISKHLKMLISEYNWWKYFPTELWRSSGIFSKINYHHICIHKPRHKRFQKAKLLGWSSRDHVGRWGWGGVRVWVKRNQLIHWGISQKSSPARGFNPDRTSFLSEEKHKRWDPPIHSLVICLLVWNSVIGNRNTKEMRLSPCFKVTVWWCGRNK